MSGEKKNKNQFLEKIPTILPVVPTIDVLAFPNMVVPLLVMDEKIICGIEEAINNESKMILLLGTKPQSSFMHDVHGNI